MSIFDLTGRVAIVTGGNGGIGLGIAQALAATGCNVSIWGRNAEKNKSAAAAMAGCSGKIDTRICDVSDPASVKSAMAATLERFGRVDGCFANAGIDGREFASPRRNAPELCMHPSPQRARGMPGARRTRSLACEIKQSTRA